MQINIPIKCLPGITDPSSQFSMATLVLAILTHLLEVEMCCKVLGLKLPALSSLSMCLVYILLTLMVYVVLHSDATERILCYHYYR